MERRTVAYCTLGCKVNQYDTDAMRTLMENDGYITVGFDCVADVYVINTCTVTHVSDKKSRQMVSRAHKLNSHAAIIVCGCYAQTAHNEVALLPGVSVVLGTRDRNKIVDVVNAFFVADNALNNNIEDSVDTLKSLQNAKSNIFEDLSADVSDKSRAFLKIQDGCNRFCTYCVIPYARGRVCSRTVHSVRRELENISKLGYQEVVLTGIHLMSYGLDFEETGIRLKDAISQADDLECIVRVRLGSLDPECVTDEFVNYLANNTKVCRQFHLSLQSGSNSVLKRMNRKYSTETYLASVKKLRERMPDCAITTDIIAGFPGETEIEFQETLEFIEKVKFSRVHAFPYSPRKGTVAANMQDQLVKNVKESRTVEIILLAAKFQDQYSKNFIGNTLPILIEECVDNMLRGYTDTYVNTIVSGGDESLIGQIANVRIENACDGMLYGSIIN